VIAAPPFRVLGQGAQFWANHYGNIFPTSGNVALQYCSTADFAQLVGTAELALTAAGCRVTYTGAPSVWLVTLCCGLTPLSAFVGQVFPFLGIDHNGDLLGGLTDQANPNPYTLDTVLNPGDVQAITVVRLVTLASGDTVQPVCGATPATATDISPDTLLMTFQPLGFVS